MYIKEILLESTPKTLYHGTIKQNLPSIMKYGVEPGVGDFTQNAYWEYKISGIELPRLLFAADKRGLQKCINAIMGAMESKGIRITSENFYEHAAIVVFKEGEEYFDYRDRDEQDSDYITVEPEDYYRKYNWVPDYYLTGKKLFSFLRKQGINLEYRFTNLDMQGKKSGAIKDILKMAPDIDKTELLKMSPTELSSLRTQLKYKQ
jgi:hypothetical protein